MARYKTNAQLSEIRERDFEDREYDETMFDEMFSDVQLLITPTPRPGYEQRWIRHVVGNDRDSINVARAERRGWTSARDAKGKIIRVMDTVLYERPKDLGDKHRAYIKKLGQRQKASIYQQAFLDSTASRIPADIRPRVIKEAREEREMVPVMMPDMVESEISFSTEV